MYRTQLLTIALFAQLQRAVHRCTRARATRAVLTPAGRSRVSVYRATSETVTRVRKPVSFRVATDAAGESDSGGVVKSL